MAIRWIVGLALASGAALCAQEPESERVFHFKNIVDPEQINEATTAIRSVGTIREVSVNPDDHTLKVTGSAAQLAYVDWALTQLDLDPRTPPAHAVIGDHLMGGNPDDAVRILRIGKAAGVQDFQEITTIIRSLAEMTVFTDNATRSILVRGRPRDVDLGQWIAEQLDPAPGSAVDRNTHHFDFPAPKAGSHPSASNTRTTIFHMSSPQTIADFQEMATAMRLTTEIRIVMTHNATKSILIRSTPGDAELCAWLLRELDRPNAGSAPTEYRYPAVDEVISVFYLPRSQSSGDFQQSAVRIREAVGIKRVFTYDRTRALVVRGTGDQVAQARGLANELVAAK